MQPYDHKKIEKKWQKEWDKKKIYQAKDDSKKSKFYGLIEFPFPSGAGMHVGHLRSNTGIDVIARKRRMEGYNVLYPIGWDAFGLPTENYAIKTGVHPKIVTKQNTDNFRKQLKSAGFSFDWSREIDTTDPEYYKWTQWIFLEMYKKGLAYKKKMVVNWCPKDKIVLANEEVIDGKCERCGTPVEKREKEQWMLAITKYADRLDKDLDTVDYQEKIKIQQRNWIGKSEGAEIEFPIKQEDPITFYQFAGSGKIHEGEPYVERDAIMALVKHWSEDKYLGLRWKKVDWETLITGGVEKGQTPEDAARAEIEQETGYKNLKLLKSFGFADSKFYHGPKKQNRFGHFHMFVFELENDERNMLTEEEQGNHDPVWLTREQLETFKLPSSHRHLVKLFEQNGKIVERKIKVFTTRPDTIFGATYVVLAPEHPFVSHFIHQCSNAIEVDAYITASKKKDEIERTAADKEKTGVELKGVKAINPATGEEIPMFVSDYVLAHYGTGAVMAVPAHDDRDFAFAKKYNLPIKEVVIPQLVDKRNPHIPGKEVVFRDAIIAVVRNPKTDKYLCLKWKKQPWTTFVMGGMENNEDPVESALREIREETGYKHVKFIKKMGMAQSEFHAAHKNVNRIAHTRNLLFELVDEEREQISQEESDIHEIEWRALSEITVDNMTHSEMPIILEGINGEPKAYTGEGILINSSGYDGYKSEEARTKIAEKFGKIKTTYKLRDWVFSRQRYWGEPIPMVHCEQCATRKPKVLILHGLTATPTVNWYQDAQERLNKLGYEVIIPDLPKSEKVLTPKDWLTALNKIKFKREDELFIVGHSLGGATAAQYILKNNLKVKKLILVAPVGKRKDWKHLKDLFTANQIKTIENFADAKIDFKKLNKLVSSTSIFASQDDPIIPIGTEKTYAELNPTTRIFADKKHFSSRHNINTLSELAEEFPSLDQNHGWVAVPEKDLPVKLPEVKNYVPTDSGESPLAAITKWVNTKCPVCGGKATRETDTMPNWAGSSWYYLRYTDPKNKKAFADRKKLDYWTQVDWYNGGMEHTTLHLLYSRFWHKFLYDIGKVPTPEPYKKRTSHGLILAADGAKISKSKGNSIEPDAIIETTGADALRLYEMFMGPFDQAVSWTNDGVIGPRRFLERVWKMQEKIVDKAPFDESLESLIHQTIDKVTNDIETMGFNTAISSLMILANAMEKKESIAKSYYQHLLKLLAPFAPHITEEIWHNLGHKTSIHTEPWDKANKAKIKAQTLIIVQVNGKVRGEFQATPDIAEEEATKRAQELPEVKKWVEGKQIKKIIFVKGKLVNIVVG
ncbi:MAG: leucine--tRNA ligase [Candidatus Paceibacter sp.]|jgi:leucyl-tRNA synthetase|nr:leucine--tRNA ligase [Candidatus Paceibacter sp.]